jgi:glycerophosphoryl diester phosphodiesterase
MNYQGNQKRRRLDPIFHKKTPLLFGHRGGALEVPESTVRGFNHAIEIAKVDVLELDVQLTGDGEFVVWHGPELDNVKLAVESDRPKDRPRKRKKIYHFAWNELDGQAWVADPDVKKLKKEDIDLSSVPEDPDRCLLLLSKFLELFPDKPLNIEMKKSFKRKINDTNRRGLKDNIKTFTDILNNDLGSRVKVVVSVHDDYIDEFRKLNGDKFPTGLSVKEQLTLQFFDMDMKNRALETSYDKHLSSEIIIEKVREAGGATFVFLTGFGFLLPAIDDEIPNYEAISEILDRGVDGIMTDRPETVRMIMNRWIEQAG